MYIFLQALAVCPLDALTQLSVSPYGNSGGRTFLHDLCNTGKALHVMYVVQWLLEAVNSPLRLTMPLLADRRTWVRDELLNKLCIKGKSVLDHLRRTVSVNRSTKSIFAYVEQHGAKCWEPQDNEDSKNYRNKKEHWDQYQAHREFIRKTNPELLHSFTDDTEGYEYWRRISKGDRKADQRTLHHIDPWSSEADMKYVIDQATRVLRGNGFTRRWAKEDMKVAILGRFRKWYLDQNIRQEQVSLVHQLVQFHEPSWRLPVTSVPDAPRHGRLTLRERPASPPKHKTAGSHHWNSNAPPRHSVSSRQHWQDGNAPRGSSSSHTATGPASHATWNAAWSAWDAPPNPQWRWRADGQEQADQQWQQKESWMEHKHEGQRTMMSGRNMAGSTRPSSEEAIDNDTAKGLACLRN